MNVLERGFPSVFQAKRQDHIPCVGNPSLRTLEEFFALEFDPVPGLFSLARSDLDGHRMVRIAFSMEADSDALERRSLELELDLCGCLDSRLP